MWCVIENEFSKLPESYQICAEYNSTQLTQDSRPSVLRLTQEQQRVPLPAPCPVELLNEPDAGEAEPVSTDGMHAETSGDNAGSFEVAEVSGTGTTEAGDDSALSDLPLRSDVRTLTKRF